MVCLWCLARAGGLLVGMLIAFGMVALLAVSHGLLGNGRRPDGCRVAGSGPLPRHEARLAVRGVPIFLDVIERAVVAGRALRCSGVNRRIDCVDLPGEILLLNHEIRNSGSWRTTFVLLAQRRDSAGRLAEGRRGLPEIGVKRHGVNLLDDNLRDENLLGDNLRVDNLLVDNLRDDKRIVPRGRVATGGDGRNLDGDGGVCVHVVQGGHRNLRGGHAGDHLHQALNPGRVVGAGFQNLHDPLTVLGGHIAELLEEIPDNLVGDSLDVEDIGEHTDEDIGVGGHGVEKHIITYIILTFYTVYFYFIIFCVLNR